MTSQAALRIASRVSAAMSARVRFGIGSVGIIGRSSLDRRSPRSARIRAANQATPFSRSDSGPGVKSVLPRPDLHAADQILVLVGGDLADVEVQLLRDAGAQVAVLAAQVCAGDVDLRPRQRVHLPEQHVVGVQVDHGVRVDRDVAEDPLVLVDQARHRTDQRW